MIHHLHGIAKEEDIQLRRTYIKEIKEHWIKLRYFCHPKKIKRATASMKRFKRHSPTLEQTNQRSNL